MNASLTHTREHTPTHKNRYKQVVMSARIVKVTFSDLSGFSSTPVDFKVAETQGDEETVLEITVVAVKVAADPNAIISVDAEYDWNTDGRRLAKKMVNETLPSFRRANNETGPERDVRRVMVSFKEKKDDDNDLLVAVLVLMGVALFVYLVKVGNKYWRHTTKAKAPMEMPAPRDLEISNHPARAHADLVNLEIPTDSFDNIGLLQKACATLRRNLTTGHALKQDSEDA